MTYRTSYAQNREDVILEAFFSDIKKGFYVDVGANHPYYHSVTKIFYDKGWRGINYEPNPKLYDQLTELRPKDENIMEGVGEKEDTLKLRVYHSQDGLEGISTFSEPMKTDYSEHETSDNMKYDDVEVKVRPLKDSLKKLQPKHIHFMKIDVEGYEYEVIRGNDWQKYRPEMICIEANHIVKDWRPLLEKAKYVLVHNDGLNNYYLAEESISRKNNFDYASVFLGSTPVISLDVAENIRSSQERYDNELNSLREILRKNDIEIKRLNNYINEITPLRKHFKRQIKQHVKAYDKKSKK